MVFIGRLVGGKSVVEYNIKVFGVQNDFHSTHVVAIICQREGVVEKLQALRSFVL